MKIKIVLFLAAALFFGGLIFWQSSKSPRRDFKATNRPALEQIRGLKLSGRTLEVQLAVSPEQRLRGLSGREQLAADRGLLFVFEQPDFYGIWMKEMKFPIDIVWFDENFLIVDLKESVEPETFPDIFKPARPALYVLETAAGFIAEQGLEVGQAAEIVKK